MLRPKKNSYKEFDNEKNSYGSKIPHPPHSQQFQMMRNRWIKRQMSWQRTERALLFFFSFLTTTTVTQVTGKSERIPVF